ncbi:MAG: DUF4419 domain-containing protein [Bryobacteraceae bacterium]
MRRLFQSKAKSHRQDHPTFAVDDVVPAYRKISSQTLARSLAYRFCRDILILPEPNKAVIDSAPAGLPQNLRANGFHPLIDAVHTAFSKHFPLTLSPDAIWLAIAQGFSHHIAENADALRPRLVRHMGRETLTADVRNIKLSSFQDAIADFSTQIRDASDPTLHETLICDFSTTTPAIRTASEIVLMDSYSSYFEYKMGCVCGIPWITVTGTVEDWQRIRARVEVLETYELGWWVGRLRPILDELVRTVQGNPNREFWQAIVKPKQSYGATTITGWIADLFPYLDDPPRRGRNQILEHKREHWVIPVDKGVETSNSMFNPEARKGVATGRFPSGLSSVPIELSLPDGSTQSLELVAGYLAVEQNPADFSLSPVVSWSVTASRPTEPIII